MIEKKSNITIEIMGSNDLRFRYGYTKTWDTEKKKAIFILMNPSKGTELQLDNTIVVINNHCVREGFGGFSILNLFPLMATDPKELSWNLHLKSAENISFIEEALKHSEDIFIAWGSSDKYKKKKREIESVLFNSANKTKNIMCWENVNGEYPKHLRIMEPTWKLVPYESKY